MGIFGWSYPAGCSGPPEDDYAPSKLVESVLVLLEDAGVPFQVNDKIVAIIENWEAKRNEEQNSDAEIDSRLLTDEPL